MEIKYNSTFINEDELFDYDIFSNHTDGEHFADTHAFRMIILWCEVGFGFILNILTLAILCRATRIDTSFRLHLINISVSDLLFCASTLFSEHVVNSLEHIQTIGLCRLSWFLVMGIVDSTMVWRLAVSIEQLIAVSSSNNRTCHTPLKKMVVAITTWLISFTLPIYYVLRANIYQWEGVDGTTLSACHLDVWGVGVIVSLILGALPVFIIVVMYVLVCCKLQRDSSYVHLQSQERAGEIQMKQTAWMLAFDGFVFLFTWLPMHMLALVLNLGVYAEHVDWFLIYAILQIIFLLKCFITPILYFISNPLFREDTKDFFCCCCRSSRVPASTDTYQLVETELT